MNRLAGITLAALAAAGVAGVCLAPRDPRPTVAWQQARDGAALDQLAAVAPNTAVSVRLRLAEPAHVHLVGYSPTRGFVACFPSQYWVGDPANPLPRGEHELMARTGDDAGPFTILLVVGHVPVPGLHDAGRTWAQLGNKAFPDRSLALYPPPARVRPAPAPPALRAALALDLEAASGPLVAWDAQPGVWLQALKIEVRP